MDSSGPNITLALIARDEETHIERCLKSVSGLDAEMIVVDTGSTDKTRDISIACGAEVLNFPWIDDFSAARNKALEVARGRWILVLDADEYLPPASVEAIRALTSDDATPHCAYHLLNKSSSDDGRTGTSGLIVRLFPNDPRVRYEWPVHEQVATSLQRAGIPVKDTSIEIIHTGYSSPEVNAAKQARNLRILEKMTQASDAVHPMVWFLKGGALLDLSRPEDALAAYVQCSQTTHPGETVYEASLVRRATCLADLKRFQEIRAIQPAHSEAEWHPEFLLLRGQAEINLGDTRTGMAFLHRVFQTPSHSRIPAYDPIRVRIRALMTIASLWEKSSPGRAVALLRLASQSMQSGHEVNLAEVLAIEQA
jgi:hypothetical protein